MGLLRVDEAQHRILHAVVRLEPERVEISEAIDRALSEAIDATRTLPPWDNSAMDGFAVRTSELSSAPAWLPISATIFAGDRPGPLVPGTCARIMTGAPLPEGADAVVMQEKTRLDGARVALDELPRAGLNVRRRGEDIIAGAPLFAAGRVLSLADLGALWGQGLTHVPLARRPKVAVASSGDELCDVGAVEEGKIVDSNNPVIAAAVRRAGGLATRLGRAADSLEAQLELFARGLEGHDVLITIAGASVGEKDFTREALSRLGVELDFWKVAMKPGKPLAFGRRGATLVFGLPGNPVSAMVTFELFVRPALRAMQGLPPLPATRLAHLGAPIQKQPGLRHFLRATSAFRDGAEWVTPLGSQSSGALSSASGATCLIDVAEAEGNIEAGSEIRVFPLSW